MRLRSRKTRARLARAARVAFYRTPRTVDSLPYTLIHRRATYHDDDSVTWTVNRPPTWERDPVTGQLWITCFCGTHIAAPIMLGEFYMTHPEVQA